ncbi:prokineticin-1-like [Pomacea canaliculata]|uniref:prokineticin-1-like n=1 Tax=Pomacea canaliculata TaxID=400727 RepID=UPI000D72E074|nr:prokineticin-1-like [Pomacea canaliculata]
MKFVLVLMVSVLALTLACEKGSDCNANECCLIQEDGSQVCKPLKQAGEECQVLSGLNLYGRPEAPVTECPCERFMRCLSLSLSATLGARGMCRGLLLS